MPEAVAGLGEPDRLVGDQRDQQRREDRERARATAARSPAGTSAASSSAQTRRCLFSGGRCASGRRRGRAGRAPCRRAARRPARSQRLVHVAERLLQPERDEHDAGDHREVEVGVGVARDLVRSRPRRRWTAGAPRPARRRRSTATTSRPRRRSPSTAAATTPASTPASAPTPIATIDSPSAMITIRPWRSAKWRGHRASSPRRRRSTGPAMSSSRRDHPERALQRRRRRTSAATSSPTPTAVPPARPTTELAQRRVVAAGEQEEGDLRARTTP